MTKLSQIQRGQSARVVDIVPGIAGRRLVEMGVYPGRTISMVRRAPLADPIEFSIGGTSLSLRESEADLVSVEALS